jgi:E3 ubiquitin-protein ligase TRIP12
MSCFRTLNIVPPGQDCEVVEVAEVEPASASALPSSLAIESSQATILRMMRVIHALNSEYADKLRVEQSRILSESAFVNNKLTAKFVRQLDELIIVAR